MDCVVPLNAARVLCFRVNHVDRVRRACRSGSKAGSHLRGGASWPRTERPGISQPDLWTWSQWCLTEHSEAPGRTSQPLSSAADLLRPHRPAWSKQPEPPGSEIHGVRHCMDRESINGREFRIKRRARGQSDACNRMKPTAGDDVGSGIPGFRCDDDAGGLSALGKHRTSLLHLEGDGHACQWCRLVRAIGPHGKDRRNSDVDSCAWSAGDVKACRSALHHN